jgi:hypothetical protein
MKVQLTALEETRSPDRSCVWEAVTTINGKTYTARSRRGASNELARLLVNADIPDAGMRLFTGNLKGYLFQKSFHEHAKYTYAESRTQPLQRGKWQDPAVTTGQFARAFGQSSAVNGRAVAMHASNTSSQRNCRFTRRA